MIAINPASLQHQEDAIAQLTETAYRAVLSRGYHGSFLELELSLWNAIRTAVERTPTEGVRDD